jgi:DNA polymerase-1
LEPDREKLIGILRELEFFTALNDIAEYPKLPEIKKYEGQDFISVAFDGKWYFGNGREIFVSEKISSEQLEGKYCINSKEIYKVLPDAGKLYDLSIGDYLILPEIEEMEKDRHNLESLALKYKAWKITSPLGAFSAHLSSLIGEGILKTLKEENLWDIYENLEIPLSRVLAYMERNGVLISREKLEELGRELDENLRGIEREIYNLAGMVFNINSPKQLATVLFERLKLPPIKKTKTGYSTDVEVLTELSKLHPLPAKILEYRELFKIKSTYVEGLKKYIQSDGRIRPNFSQTTTATGRLSCLNPNLQNIPARGTWGKKVRECFIAPEGYKIVSFDYSQIELRILAHLSGDENLREVFYRNGDVHMETAKALFGKDEISDDERRVAKTVNFGIIYGISPYGLSRSIGVDQDTAREMIRRYYERFPRVKRWQEEMIDFASKNGFVQTLLGRRRYIFADPRVNDEYRRITINTPVQGSAADLIKKAMIEIYELIKGKNSKMILQVHDELVFEIQEDEMDLIPKIREIMENAIKLDVPIVVEVGVGESWAHVKG